MSRPVPGWRRGAADASDGGGVLLQASSASSFGPLDAAMPAADDLPYVPPVVAARCHIFPPFLRRQGRWRGVAWRGGNQPLNHSQRLPCPHGLAVLPALPRDESFQVFRSPQAAATPSNAWPPVAATLCSVVAVPRLHSVTPLGCARPRHQELISLFRLGSPGSRSSPRAKTLSLPILGGATKRAAEGGARGSAASRLQRGASAKPEAPGISCGENVPVIAFCGKHGSE